MILKTIRINGIRYKLTPDTKKYRNLVDNIYGYLEVGNVEKAEELLRKFKKKWGSHLPDYTEAVVYILHMKDRHELGTKI